MKFRRFLTEHIELCMKEQKWEISTTKSAISTAEAADITTVYLSKIENGKVTPTLDTLGAVCAAVNADLGYVLSGCQYSQKTYGSETVLQLFQSCTPEVKPIALAVLKDLAALQKDKDKE